MFIHLGNTDGAGAGPLGGGDEAEGGGAAEDCGDCSGGGALEAACVLGGATHLVQIVEVMVLNIVETVRVVRMTLLLPDVMVLVTGHVVRVVRTL